MDCLIQSEGWAAGDDARTHDTTRQNSEVRLTSIGDRNVTVKFMGPACISKIVRVGVILTFVTFAIGVSLSFPIQLYTVPSTLTFPRQPTSGPWRFVRRQIAYDRHEKLTVCVQNFGHALESGCEPFVETSQVLR